LFTVVLSYKDLQNQPVQQIKKAGAIRFFCWISI